MSRADRLAMVDRGMLPCRCAGNVRFSGWGEPVFIAPRPRLGRRIWR